MPSAQSLALSDLWLYLFFFPCQPHHPGFTESCEPWKGTPGSLSTRTPGSLWEMQISCPTSALHNKTGPDNLCGQAPWDICMHGQSKRHPSGDPRVWFYSLTLTSLSRPAPPHSWEQCTLQVWEETEVGSGKGLLTQYFRMDRQRVWRVLAHPCLKTSQQRGELKRGFWLCPAGSQEKEAGLQGRAPKGRRISSLADWPARVPLEALASQMDSSPPLSPSSLSVHPEEGRGECSVWSSCCTWLPSQLSGRHSCSPQANLGPQCHLFCVLVLIYIFASPGKLQAPPGQDFSHASKFCHPIYSLFIRLFMKTGNTAEDKEHNRLPTGFFAFVPF